MRHLKAFALGFVAVAALTYAAAATIAIAAQTAGDSLAIGVGPLVVVSVSADQGGSVTTFGSGLAVLAVLGGATNLLVAAFVRRSPDDRSDRVE